MNHTTKQTNRLFVRPAFILALVLGALAFAGCNTMEGAGEDIERAGENLQNAADRNR